MKNGNKKTEGKNNSRRSEQQEVGHDVSQICSRSTSNHEDGEIEKGTTLRRALGLTATIETGQSSSTVPSILVPYPFPECCLKEESESTRTIADDPNSLLKLTKHVFNKLSKNKTAQWNPTPIQLQSWPILKSNSSMTTSSAAGTTDLNLVAIATTGSGKTLSYAIPMIDSCSMVQGKKSRRYVHGLVLVPTRELALQVSKVLKMVANSANKLSKQTDKIVALPIYGGVDREEQIDSLSTNSQYVLAATPLRLIDILGIGDTDANGNESVPNQRMQSLFESTRYLVIDEADTMAVKTDMSQQIQSLVTFLRQKCTRMHRQCLFSATLPRRAIAKCNDWIPLPRVTVKVDTLTVGKSVAKDTVNDVSTTTGGVSSTNQKVDRVVYHQGLLDASTIPAHITQTLHVCSNDQKMKNLIITIQQIRNGEKKGGNGRRKGLLIIFFGRIKTLQYVYGLLQKERIQGVPFHSQMNQKKRETQLNLFRSGKCPILLSTDVVARGIHIKNVEYIINYDFPESIEQYVHRCGRAGRSKISGRVGDRQKEKSPNATVYSFFNREHAPMANDVIDLLRSCNAWIDPNLIALVPGGIKEGDSESKRKRQECDKNKTDEADTIDSNVVNMKKKKPDINNMLVM